MKRKNYKVKFLIISILKNKINKNNFKTIIIKKIKGKEKKYMLKKYKKYYNNSQVFQRKRVFLAFF